MSFHHYVRDPELAQHSRDVRRNVFRTQHAVCIELGSDTSTRLLKEATWSWARARPPQPEINMRAPPIHTESEHTLDLHRAWSQCCTLLRHELHDPLGHARAA